MSLDKIIIVHGLPDTNSGGSALGISLIKVLKSHFPTHRINYVSTHSREDIIERAHPFIRAKYPEVEILPYPLVAREDSYDIRNKYFQKLSKLIWVMKTVLSIVFVVFPFLKNNRTLNEIKSSSIVISRGTNIFYEKKGKLIRSTLAIYWLCFPLLMAWRYHKPYVIYAQSFGPLHSPFNRLMLRFVLNRAALVLPREKLSADYLKSIIKISDEKIRIVPDSVFGLKPPTTESIQEICRTYELPYKRYLVLVVRELMNVGDSLANRFPILKGVSDHLLENNKIEKCVVVTQCHSFEGYSGFESDSEISKELFDYLRNGGSNSVVLIDKPLSPEELQCLYGGAKYVIALRLHAAIFSLISGTPTLAISYWGFKTKGIMKMLDRSEWMLDINGLSKDLMIDKLNSIEKNYVTESEKLANQMKQIYDRACRTPLLFKDLLTIKGVRKMTCPLNP